MEGASKRAKRRFVRPAAAGRPRLLVHRPEQPRRDPPRRDRGPAPSPRSDPGSPRGKPLKLRRIGENRRDCWTASTISWDNPVMPTRPHGGLGVEHGEYLRCEAGRGFLGGIGYRMGRPVSRRHFVRVKSVPSTARYRTGLRTQIGN